MAEEQKIIWKPFPKQEEALRRQEFEILYGGSRGGGKSDCGMAWLLYDIDNPRLRQLVIRKNAKDLDDWNERARVMFAGTRAVFTQGKIRFPSGATIILGHLKDENAYEQYQGHEYQRILIEELEQIPSEDLYLKLISSCRSTDENLKPQVFTTANPGGRGHLWIKQRWRLPDGIPTGNIITEDKITGRSRIFIPSTVDDNPAILEKDPTYVDFLNSLPSGLREAWREGSWAEMEIKGAYYSACISDAKKQGRITNVPYDNGLLVHTVWDLGIGKNLTVGFYQKIENQIHLINSWEGNEKDGIPQAKAFMDTTGYAFGLHFAPHDIEQTETGTGKTRKETASRFGIDFITIPRMSVEDGIEAGRLVFPRLWIDEENNKNFVEAIRLYHKEYDEERQIYKPTPYKDWTNHYADFHRYMAIVEGGFTNNLSQARELLARCQTRKEYGSTFEI